MVKISTERTNWVVSGTVIFIMFMVLYMVPISGNSRIVTAYQNAGHWILFSVLTFGACRVVVGAGIARRTVLIAVPSGMIILGFAGELLQIPLSRDADWLDIARNILGVLSGMLIFGFLILVRQRRYLIGSLFLLGTLVIAVINLRNPAQQTIASITSPSLPTIATFDNAGASLRIRSLQGAVLNLVQSDYFLSGTPSKSLHIVFSDRPYSGVEFLDLHNDWSTYTKLVTRIVNTGPEIVELAVRIVDSPDDMSEIGGYHLDLDLEPGLNVVEVKFANATQLTSREMNMHDVNRLVFYASDASSAGYELILDDVVLEN